MKIIILALCVLIAKASAYSNSDIVSSRIESCRGCSLNRLPQVKEFIMTDAPQYDRVEVKFITGAPPELILLGENDKELERIPLSERSREQCIELLEKNGFTKKIKSEL